MIKLSVVIITYNEEKNIENCLQSLIDVADEIIVVDSFSEDRTKELCLRYNVVFIEHEFEGYIEQKNWAKNQAKYEHVLSVDADEVLSDELKESIKEVKKTWTKDGYYMKRLNNYCGKWIKHSGWYPDKKLRLFNNSKGTWSGHNPHDKIEMEDDATIAVLKGNLLHYSFYSIKQHIDQINKFSEIKAEVDFKNNKKFNYFKLLLFPVFKFFRWYFINLGILDGFYGLVICINSAHGEFIRYVKLRKLREQSKI